MEQQQQSNQQQQQQFHQSPHPQQILVFKPTTSAAATKPIASRQTQQRPLQMKTSSDTPSQQQQPQHQQSTMLQLQQRPLQIKSAESVSSQQPVLQLQPIDNDQSTLAITINAIPATIATPTPLTGASLSSIAGSNCIPAIPVAAASLPAYPAAVVVPHSAVQPSGNGVPLTIPAGTQLTAVSQGGSALTGGSVGTLSAASITPFAASGGNSSGVKPLTQGIAAASSALASSALPIVGPLSTLQPQQATPHGGGVFSSIIASPAPIVSSAGSLLLHSSLSSPATVMSSLPSQQNNNTNNNAAINRLTSVSSTCGVLVSSTTPQVLPTASLGNINILPSIPSGVSVSTSQGTNAANFPSQLSASSYTVFPAGTIISADCITGVSTTPFLKQPGKQLYAVTPIATNQQCSNVVSVGSNLQSSFSAKTSIGEAYC